MALEFDVVLVEAVVHHCFVLFMISANPLLHDQETRAILDRRNSYAANEVSSNYTASRYEDVSEGEFTKHEEIHREVNWLEREYFVLCHQPDAGVNDTFTTSNVGVYGKILMNSEFFVPQDSEQPLTYLIIYNAPYELSDDAIIHQLSPYCDVMWHRCGKFLGTAGAVFNGFRHYRICLDKLIPSYLCFGKFLLCLQYEGQIQTCWKCNWPYHKTTDYKNTICFNCDGVGHEACECVRPLYCCICKSRQHLACE